MMKQIVALGGGGFSDEPENPLLEDFILGLTGKPRPKVCFVSTASGDSEKYQQKFFSAFPAERAETACLTLFPRTEPDLRALVLSQDVIYVGGGSTVNMLAVWRAHGLDAILREAWEAGIVLCGVSAGALCWFEAGSTDSWGNGPVPFEDGLGFLPGSFCPHYDGEVLRRPAYRQFVADGMQDGFGVEDSAALHFADTLLVEAVASRPNAQVYRVERRGHSAEETPVVVRFLG
ncbi:MAG: Type 1 glutamine amidotransferase-like domain-containing protein [Janthinobacterium lividum]